MIYVALLRGINVGGNTMIKMADLRLCFGELGLKNVSTYINSVNVIFESASTDPEKLEAKIEKALHQQFSFKIVVVVRSLAEMTDLIKLVPSSWQKPDQKLNVIFLHRSIDSL